MTETTTNTLLDLSTITNWNPDWSEPTVGVEA